METPTRVRRQLWRPIDSQVAKGRLATPKQRCQKSSQSNETHSRSNESEFGQRPPALESGDRVTAHRRGSVSDRDSLFCLLAGLQSARWRDGIWRAAPNKSSTRAESFLAAAPQN